MKRDRHSPPTGWKKVRYRLEVAAAKFLVWFACRLPRRAVRNMGRCLGSFAYRFAGEARRAALVNLDLAFGDAKTPAEKNRIARSCFQNAVATLLGLFWMPRLTKDNFERYIEIDPATLEKLRAIHARGKGILFITLHYGDWEMLGQAAAYYGLPLTTVVEQMRNPGLLAILNSLREHSGNTMVQQRFATTRLFKALKRGECVAMLTDLNAIPRFGGVWCQYFGMPVFNNATAAILALRTGAAIVGGVAYPLPDGRARVECSDEITFAPTGNETADIQTISQLCSDYCETVVRRTPEFWLWSYKRWKFRPTEEQDRFPGYSRHLPR